MHNIMKDKIDIKAIHGQLIWNIPIIDLIETTCYNINYLTNKIEVFLSRGELVEGIEFIRAEIGTFSLSEINNLVFNHISFELITPEEEVNKIIQTQFDKSTDVKLSNGRLIITYTGSNPKIPSSKSLLSENKLDLNNPDNWIQNISTIRPLLNFEYRYFDYDYNYNVSNNYGWLNFKDISVLGLSKFNFRAYFQYNNEGIINIETDIGTTKSEYDKVKSHFINLYGLPSKTNEDKLDINFNHNFKDDIWLTEKLQIRLHSAYIARSEPEQFNYELEIRKYCA